MLQAELIFDKLQNNFFSPLTGEYQVLYLECVIRLYDYIHQSATGKITRTMLNDLFLGAVREMHINETGEKKAEQDILRVRDVIRRMKECGWTEEAYSKQEEEMEYRLTDSATKVVGLFIQLCEPTAVSVGAYMSAIRTALESLASGQARNPYTTLVLVERHAKELMQSLQDVQQRTKKRVEEMTKEKEIESLLLSGQIMIAEFTVDGVMQKLLQNERITSSDHSMVERTTELISLSPAIRERMWEEARSQRLFPDQLSCDEQIDRILENILEIINHRYEEKLKTVMRQLKKQVDLFSMSWSNAIQSGSAVEIWLSSIFTMLRLFDEEDERTGANRTDLAFQKLVELLPGKMAVTVEEDSLKNPPTALEEDPEPDPVPDTSDEVIKIENNIVDPRYQPKELNKYVKQLLTGRNSIKFSDMSYESNEDMMMMLSLLGTADTTPYLCEYTIEPTGETVSTKYGSFSNFIIREKNR